MALIAIHRRVLFSLGLSFHALLMLVSAGLNRFVRNSEYALKFHGTPVQYTTEATMTKVSGRVFGGSPDACSELNKRDWNRVFE